ncbi:hypothetical protein LWI29_038358 [Acer saccharum]|uniref:VQ domain-containing protein n=1 Tax=Acer saccharum TaxID=4024 RepID=A0AA39RWL9_ACESA|nr:hypothetical protein LWI29_038358 [Acer saccharum]KAK1557024.1 hypothetical protein Q3G72_016319 [Acer saccharum]
MSSNKREAVKVVLMDTQYVQVDSTSFKSVVQKLTGKDSCVAWIKESSSSEAKNTRSSVEDHKLDLNQDLHRSVSKIELSKGGMSFKDLDRLMLEASPPEELQWLWNEYNLR